MNIEKELHFYSYLESITKIAILFEYRLKSIPDKFTSITEDGR